MIVIACADEALSILPIISSLYLCRSGRDTSSALAVFSAIFEPPATALMDPSISTVVCLAASADLVARLRPLISHNSKSFPGSSCPCSIKIRKLGVHISCSVFYIIRTLPSFNKVFLAKVNSSGFTSSHYNYIMTNSMKYLSSSNIFHF